MRNTSEGIVYMPKPKTELERIVDERKLDINIK